MLAGGLLTGMPARPAVTGGRLRVPRALRAGDVVGLTSPAGYITLGEVQPAVGVIRSWGFEVRYGEALGRREGSLGGSDAERAGDLQRMIDDPSVRAVLCARGGYGVTRILDRLDLRPLRRDPKWFIGFSDITALHLHLWRNLRLASIHAKMCNSFPSDWSGAEPIVRDTILSIRSALTGSPGVLASPPHPADRNGRAEGPLVGGNLTLLSTTLGTPYEVDTRGKIFFIEDVDEQPYSIDRMLTHLRLAGKLDAAAGIVFGECADCRPRDYKPSFTESNFSLPEVVDRILGNLKVPVLSGLTIGHTDDQLTLPLGVNATLDAGKGTLTLDEAATV